MSTLDPRLLAVASIPGGGVAHTLIWSHPDVRLVGLRADVATLDGAVVAWVNPVTQTVERLTADQVTGLRPA